MPVQLDGSRHTWLEDQGPKFVLLLAGDAAAGTRGETSQATGFGVAVLL